MIYLLDTNVISAVRRSGRAPAVAAWLRAQPEEALFLSAVTLGEIERGISEWTACKVSYEEDKVVVNKKNFFEKTYAYAVTSARAVEQRAGCASVCLVT